jgi:hypothetical protein
MDASRRVFLNAAVTLVAATAAGAAQERHPPSPFPIPSQGPPSQPPAVPKPDRSVLKMNRETITKDVARMAELIEQLQKALEANSTTEVLSLDVLRKSEEIEKLAKQVKDLVRG